MIDRAAQLLESNLALLPSATQQTLRMATEPPAVRLEERGACIHASIRTADGRLVPVHSSEDPIAVSAGVAARFTAQKPPLIIVVGLGLGYLLDALEAQQSPARVLSIEPLPAVTRAMLSRRDWSQWLTSGRLTILAGPDYTGSTEVWGLFGQGAMTPPIIMAPLIEREFPDEARRATALVRQIVAGAKANEDARRQFAGRYLINTLTNIPTIATEGDVAALVDAFSRVPAVVVAAGPSLDRNLKDLARIDGRVLIIAVDTAVRPLLAAGIHPHLVVSVDPSEQNARHLERLPDCRGSWLVAEASTNPSMYPQFTGRTFTFNVSDHHPWPWLEAQGTGRGKLRAWGSVLTTAFDLACRAGCDPIVFAGADLAYTRGLQYCRNTVYEDKWRDFPTDEKRVEVFKQYLATHAHLTQPDVHGHDVTTTPHFVQFRDWIVSRANEAADRRVVNATGGGILHGGRIAQTDFSVLHLPRTKNDPELHRRLHSAWNSGQNGRRAALPQLQRALEAKDRLPLETWVDFGRDTASQPQVEGAVDYALAGVTRHSRTSAYLTECGIDADAHATTLTQAKAWIHPNYDVARAQAEGQQAHVLLDFAGRTHPIVANSDARAIVASAATPLSRVRVLDIGCGTGRTMEPLVAAGCQVDGVDISQRMIDLARENTGLPGSQFFVSDGNDCGAAADGAYDIVTLHLTLHLIKSRSVRQTLLRAAARASRPGGMCFVQMPFYPECDSATVPAPHVSWQADVEGPTRPGGHVWPTPDALPAILSDFRAVLRDIRLQFIDFPDGMTLQHGSRPITHVLVSGTPAGTLAARIYALPASPTRQSAVLAFRGASTQK